MNDVGCAVYEVHRSVRNAVIARVECSKHHDALATPYGTVDVNLCLRVESAMRNELMS